jgi:hypothetical protein
MKNFFLKSFFLLFIANINIISMPKLNLQNILIATIGSCAFIKFTCNLNKNLAEKLKFLSPFESNFKYSLNKTFLDTLQKKLPNPLTGLVELFETPFDILYLYRDFKKTKAFEEKELILKQESKELEPLYTLNKIKKNELWFVSEKNFNWGNLFFGASRAAINFLVFKYANKYLQNKFGINDSDLAGIVSKIGVSCIVPSIIDIIQNKLSSTQCLKNIIVSADDLREDGAAKLGYNLVGLLQWASDVKCLFNGFIGSFNIFEKLILPKNISVTSKK